MKKYGLIGVTLKHSFSKNYFTKKFLDEGIDAQYELYELEDISKFQGLISSVKLSGLNVTIPFKEQVMPLLDEIDGEAREIGAVNTIKFVDSNNGSVKLCGYNTDVIGFRDSISPMLNSSHKRALVLGTGGASKAVVFVLKKLGIEPLLVSRREAEGTITYAQMDKPLMDECSVIVNTTPVGMFPNVENAPDIPYQYVTDKHVVYDLIYNPLETTFCKRCKANGAAVQNGLAMLHGQAEASWHIWNM